MFFKRKGSAVEPPAAPVGRAEPMVIDGRHAVLNTSMVEPFPDGFEKIIVAMGCFWGPENAFAELDGVYTTAAGYAGGTTPNPTYDEVSEGLTGHAESVLVVFDPKVVGLEDLLAKFWEQHDPTTPRGLTGFGSNYRSALFTTTPEQLEVALKSRDRYQARLTDIGYTKIRTEIRPADEFYYAENYHQQYMHKNPKAFCATGFCQVSYS